MKPALIDNEYKVPIGLAPHRRPGHRQCVFALARPDSRIHVGVG